MSLRRIEEADVDEADLGNMFAERYLQGALARNAACRPCGAGPECCEECGEVIPPARREAVPGCRLCVGCQRALESECA